MAEEEEEEEEEIGFTHQQAPTNTGQLTDYLGGEGRGLGVP